MIDIEQRITELRTIAAGDGVELNESSLRQLRGLARLGLLVDAHVSVIYDGEIQVEWGAVEADYAEIELHGIGCAEAIVYGAP